MKKRQHKNFIKGKTFDRRGMVIELALLVLFVVFACSTLLVTSVFLGGRDLSAKHVETSEKAVVEELAERLLDDPELDIAALGIALATDRFEGYTYEWHCDEQSAIGKTPTVGYQFRYEASLDIKKEGETDPVLTVELYAETKAGAVQNTVDVLFTVVGWHYRET